ncbi:MAG: thiamine pyrophosphate-dependent enzyme, partial [Euryarchaeota archaeon]|nr:thiamine pyrophosphate-dependent enzyme [Euryarchaeota archaeon]
GIQRSGATPYGARTTTSPPGKFSIGNERPKKDMVMIMAAHEVPYVATACTSYPYDFAEKMIKASKTKGLSYIHILAPCPVGWGFPAEKTVELGRLAVETGMWPLYEVENGKLRITYWPAQKKPVKQYLIAQSRFKHLPKEEIEKIQKMIDEKLAEIESYAKS